MVNGSKSKARQEAAFPPIAVVGVSALLPGSTDVGGFWRSVVTAQDLISDVPPTHWDIDDYYDPDPSAEDKTYGRRGAFLEPVDFDPLEFGVPPTTMPAVDTTQLLALVAAARVLDDATGGDLSRVDGERTAVILGASALEMYGTMTSRQQRPVWLAALRESGVPEELARTVCERIAARYAPWQPESFPGLLSNVVSGRIANRFDLRGTNHVTDAACAGSFAALRTAVNELALKQADLVITGGVDTLNDITMYMCFSKTPALSPTGDSRPFSDAADGTVLGEGLAMFALKRLADAERAGDQVYAVLRGVGSASDGRGSAVYTPVAPGQERALRRAYEAAGYGPETVELVEGHGTGTKVGDATELRALGSVFANSGRKDAQWCALGSVKSQLGHTKSAAGAVGLLKAVLALRHGVLPPTIKVDRPHPALGTGDGPLYVNTEARPWVRDDRHPRRASVSSFGFGGSDFHVTAEEYVPAAGSRARPAARYRNAPSELVLLCGATPDELVRRIDALLSCEAELADTARATQQQFDRTAPLRLAVVATDTDDLAVALRRVAERVAAGETHLPLSKNTFFASGSPSPGKVAFLFPGQGSQYPGMGADVAMEFPTALGAWDRAASLRLADVPLDRVVFPVPAFDEETRAAQEARLTATEWAQPALAVTSLALLRLLSDLGVRPDAVAGHSFGELVALHAAGAIDERTLLLAARRRGEVMRDAASSPGVREGGMLAVAATQADVEAVLAGSGDRPVWISGENGPGQVTVAGELSALTEFAAELAAAGMASRRLNTSAAFHTPVMATAEPAMKAFWAGVKVRGAEIPVYGNADAGVYPSRPAEIRARLVEHLTAPVRFRAQIERMYGDGVRTFVEVGAGNVLTGLVGKILADREHTAVSTERRGRSGVSELQRALGRLAVAGVDVRFPALWEGVAEPLRPKRSAMTVPILGANYGKPALDQAHVRTDVATRGVASRPEQSVHDEEVTMKQQQSADATQQPLAGVAHAIAEVTRQAAEAHAAYTRSMAETHLAFLQLAQTSVARLSGTDAQPAAGIPLPVPTEDDVISGVPATYALPQPAPVTAPGPVGAGAVPDAEVPRPTAVALLDTPREAAVDAPAVPQAAPPAPPAAPAAQDAVGSLDGDDVAATLLEVVSEKTGFPVDMLELGLELETDLGIDSIKRVEILSVLKQKLPGLPDLEAGELGRMRSLGEIVDTLKSVPSGPGK